MKLTTTPEAVRRITSRFLAVLQIHQEDEHANNVGPLEKKPKLEKSKQQGLTVSETLRFRRPCALLAARLPSTA